ncbi:MAG: 4Fe-4S dicluster domain-containing protein [Thermoleophilia bacterium]
MGRGGRILVQSDICSGCRACMLACVAAHEGGFGYAAARIRVTKIETEGLDVPSVCRLCRKPGCVAACPAGALSRDPVLGVVRLDEEECIACGACAEGCPFGMVILHPTTGLPLICDLCGGDPSCVKRCAPGAIHWGGVDEQARERREALALREGGGARDSDTVEEHVGASGVAPARFRANRPPARPPRGGGSLRAAPRNEGGTE